MKEDIREEVYGLVRAYKRERVVMTLFLNRRQENIKRRYHRWCISSRGFDIEPQATVFHRLCSSGTECAYYGATLLKTGVVAKQ